MINREYEHFLRTNDASPSFATLTGGIEHGLDWQGAGALDASPVVFEEINREVGDHLLRITDHLRLPSIPDVLLIRDWTKLTPERQEPEEEVIADAYFDADIPNRGIIRLSPDYLKTVVDRKMGRLSHLPLPLPLVLGHEGFHLYQFLVSPAQIAQDIREKGQKGLSAWIVTKSETQAKEFERYWLENWHRF